MAIQLTAEQRDALFARILLDFSAFDDLQRAVGQGDLEEAYALGRKIGDGFRLIVDGGLGWARKTAEPLSLTLPATELVPLMTRMKWEAEAHYESMRPDREETQREWAEISDARDACTAVLDQID